MTRVASIDRIALFVLSAIFYQKALLADVVILRSGIRYTDVKAEPSADSHRIRFQDGRIQIVPNSEIRSVRPAVTTWSQPHIIEMPNIVTNPVPVVSEAPTVQSPDAGRHGLPSTGRPMIPILKSTIFPGWGQLAEGRNIAGTVYASATLIALQRYWTFRQEHAAAQRDYNNPIPVGLVASQTITGSLGVAEAAAINFMYLSRKESEVYRLQEKGNTILMVLPILWIWNLLDIAYGGVPWEKRWFGSSRDSAPVISLNFRRDAILAVVSFSL